MNSTAGHLLRGIGWSGRHRCRAPALLSACGTPERKQDAASASRRISPPRRRSWSSPTGPSTSTRTTRTTPRRSPSSRRPPASRSTTRPTSTTTTSSSPRCRTSSARARSTKRDMFVLTDWMAARMIQAGWIQKLDASKVPNLHANLIAASQNVSFDKKREYSAPWQSGLTGIAYNKSKVKEVKSFEELITRKDLKGRVSAAVGDERHDGADAALRGRRPDQLHRRRVAEGDGQAPEGRRATASSARSPATSTSRTSPSGNVVACEAWSGDVAAAEDENLVFVTPEEGHMIWADNMLVPNKADPQGQRREVDQLLLRAGGRGQAGGVRLVHLPGQGRAGGHGEGRLQPRRQRADLPHREDALGQPRLHGARGEEGADSTREPSPMSSVDDAGDAGRSAARGRARCGSRSSPRSSPTSPR